MKKTTVIFRKEADGEILAVFPYETFRNSPNVPFYVHNGQHGELDYSYVVRKTKKATAIEYSDLKAELESLGYNLKVAVKACRNKMYLQTI